MKKSLQIIIIFLFISFSACNYFESDNPTGISQIELSVSNLQTLADSLVYVGWVITSTDSAFKIFESNVGAGGVITATVNNNFGGLHKAQQFHVTVEEVPDSGSITSPGSSVVLSGRFTLGAAQLRIGTGTDISSSSSTGSYTITTPTDTTDNDLSGIWFTRPATAFINKVTQEEAGLNIPVLIDGWTYEGLIIINNDTLRTGLFIDPDAADDFSGYSGSVPGFPFPGEDFLVNPPAGLTFPLDLSNARVLVTLNYSSDDYDVPYSYVLFESTVPAGVQANTTHTMQKLDVQVPAGIVSIKVDVVE